MTGAEQRKSWLDPEPEVPLAAELAMVAEEAPARSPWPRLFGAAAILLALGWIAALVYGVAVASPAGGPGLLRIAAWIGLASGPLALLAIIAVLVLRSGRSEANAYARAAAGLRAESETLAALLALLTRRIESARSGLAEQSGTLEALGNEATARLQRAGDALAAQAAGVAATAAALDDSAASARTDLGVVLADLPQAEALAKALGAQLQALGQAGNAQAELLTQRVAALEAGARTADQSSVGAARRLAAELDRVESGVAAVDRRLGEAAARIEQANVAALDGSTEALERVRRGVDAQGAALQALVGQAEAALAERGSAAQAAFGTQVAALTETSARIADELRQHDQATAALVARVEGALGAIERRFAALGEQGAGQLDGVGEAVGALSAAADALGQRLDRGNEMAGTLAARAEAIRAHVEATGSALGDGMPAALARLRLQTEQALRPLAEAQPQAEALAARTGELVERLGTIAPTLAEHGEAIAGIGRSADERLEELTARADRFRELVATTETELRGLADGASLQLVDALLRVRDTASAAAGHAREALAAAIPAAAADLGTRSAEAMRTALNEVGEPQVTALGAASARAVEAAQAASDRLGRQLAALDETAARIEARTAADDETGFARQMGLLIEALNSGAIDIAKIFSNEPTDTAWAAYLKGDRGVFTRRAVHLLEGGEARSVASRYGDDPEFREQVNRYVHDFEAMLRRVLAAREGGPLGVTLLSSDAGKLYVLLAQAIERLRR